MSDFFDALSSKREKESLVKQITSMPTNYVGGKRRLLIHIADVLEKNEIEYDSVFDAFSGSAIVSLMFKLMGKRVVCNDLLTSSAITAVCLLENDDVPLTQEEIKFLCSNVPSEHGNFVKENYLNKFFTEKECMFLDRYKANVAELFGEKYYSGLELLNKATLSSIPNSNFSVYGKDLKSLRSTHKVGESFWNEKWRDTTRKRRDANNEIMFDKSILEVCNKYKGAFSLFAIENHINRHCFLGGRYYNGQTVAKLEHRLQHDKTKGREVQEIPMDVESFRSLMCSSDEESIVFNSDVVELLEAEIINADLIYLDPPYGGSSSDYAMLYRFLEEYVHEAKLEDLEHIQKGSKRFCRKKNYQSEFEHLLSLCGNFKTWLLSYNESSYADIDTIVSTIKNAGKKNVTVCEVPITYQYRKDKSVIDKKQFKESYAEDGHKYLQRGIEYLILAQ